MQRITKIKYIAVLLVLMFSILNVSSLHAQKIVASGNKSAGFRFSTEISDSAHVSVRPIIHYQQNIAMLSGIDDRPSLSVYGDGHVVVHYPEYMKKAGDYEMKLSDDELVGLIQSLSENGVLDFDEDKVKKDIRAKRKAHKERGQFYAISDATETVVEVRLDEYQKNKLSKRIKNFNKRFRWKNIEHDAARFKQQRDIVDANRATLRFQGMMKDSRLKKNKPQADWQGQ